MEMCIMQVQAINNRDKLSYQQKQTNFKALKGISFVGPEIQFNHRAQNELLKIFDHEPVKDIFTKFDGNVEFKAKTIDIVKQSHYVEKYYENNPIIYKIECSLNLFNQHLKNLSKTFQELAKNADVNIDADLSSYTENFKTVNFELGLGRYDRLLNYDIKEVLDKKQKYDDEIIEATMAIQRLENGSYVLPEGDIRDKKYWNNSLKRANERQEEIMPEIELYNENKKTWNNVFLIAAKNLVSSVLRMDSKEVEEKIPEKIRLKEVVEQDLDNILQDAICEKNVKNKLKELLGENYIEPEKQVKIDLRKKFGVDLEKPIHKPQEVEEEVVNKGRKTKKPSIKKADKK